MKINEYLHIREFPLLLMARLRPRVLLSIPPRKAPPQLWSTQACRCISSTPQNRGRILDAKMILNIGYSRPPPLYEDHVPLSTPERILLAFGSAFMSLYNPWRGGLSYEWQELIL